MLSDTANHHLLRYWDRCRAMFRDGDYPMAAFCAITLMEEIGKVPMLTLRGADGKLNMREFTSHHKKYDSAVGMTLFVNSRVARIYGERENEFARWYRDGELMKIRNSALYMDVKGDNVITPNEAISLEKSFLLVCFAGEVLAEAQGVMTGTGPEEWQRILAEVDEFRTRHDPPH